MFEVRKPPTCDVIHVFYSLYHGCGQERGCDKSYLEGICYIMVRILVGYDGHFGGRIIDGGYGKNVDTLLCFSFF